MGYKLGKKVVEGGVWFDYEGAELLIGRSGSVDWLKAQEQLERPYRRQIDKGKLSAKVRRELNVRALARAVLLDWRNVEDEKGNGVAYTEELGYQAMLDDPSLLEFVIDTSTDVDNFALEEEEKVIKKSAKPSTG